MVTQCWAASLRQPQPRFLFFNIFFYLERRSFK